MALLASLDVYFDDLGIGDRFVTRGRTVTEADIVMFAGMSGDSHPLHVDASFAERGPFGARIAHGLLTLSLASGLESALMSTADTKILAFAGLDRVRLLKPVFIGDTIHLEGAIAEMAEKDTARGLVTIHQEIKNQRAELVAVFDKRLLYRRRSNR